MSRSRACPYPETRAVDARAASGRTRTLPTKIQHAEFDEGPPAAESEHHGTMRQVRHTDIPPAHQPTLQSKAGDCDRAERNREQGNIGECVLPVVGQALVDQRDQCRHPSRDAEHRGHSEISHGGDEGQGRSGDQPRAGEGQHDRQNGSRRRGALRSRHFDEIGRQRSQRRPDRKKHKRRVVQAQDGDDAPERIERMARPGGGRQADGAE